jgi:hypothetical protein
MRLHTSPKTTSLRLVINSLTCSYACLYFRNILAFYKYSVARSPSLSSGLVIDFPVMIDSCFILMTHHQLHCIELRNFYG